MASLRTNATRVKRFRALKQDLRTRRDRLLVGLDIGKAQHMAQVRVAHTQVLDKTVPVPNTLAGFTALWTRLQTHQRATGCREVVCALEPTGTYHQAVAQALEAHGVDVVFVSNAVAHLNRRTLDGTWDKNDPKDAANLCDLLEQGKVLFYVLPEAPTGDLRTLVKLLREARAELAACKARWRNTLRPALGPAGEPLPAQGRIASLEAVLVEVAATLPAYPLLQTIPGVGPTVAAILVAEIGDITWDYQALATPEARGARHYPIAVGAVGRHPAHLPERAHLAPLGPVSGGPGSDADRRRPGRAPGAGRQAGRGSARRAQGDGGGGRGDPADRLGGVAESGALCGDPGAQHASDGPVRPGRQQIPIPGGSGERLVAT
jgi:hypothetical protein